MDEDRKKAEAASAPAAKQEIKKDKGKQKDTATSNVEGATGEQKKKEEGKSEDRADVTLRLRPELHYEKEPLPPPPARKANDDNIASEHFKPPAEYNANVPDQVWLGPNNIKPFSTAVPDDVKTAYDIGAPSISFVHSLLNIDVVFSFNRAQV